MTILLSDHSKQYLHVCIGYNDTVIERYLTSFYWAAATSASVGYGDLHAIIVEEVRLTVHCFMPPSFLPSFFPSILPSYFLPSLSFPSFLPSLIFAFCRWLNVTKSVSYKWKVLWLMFASAYKSSLCSIYFLFTATYILYYRLGYVCNSVQYLHSSYQKINAISTLI